MTELSFAKSFLSTLDSKPTKLSPDHYEDPKSYPARGAYILPKMPKPLTRRTPLAPGQERSLTVTLKSLRNPPLDLKLKSQPPLLSIHDLKAQVSSQTSIPATALRLLHKKKPVSDSKVLKDLVGEDDTAVEFSIMVIGGAAAVVGKGAEKGDVEMGGVDKETAQPAQGPSGKEVLGTDLFWDDLKSFLLQRLRDEAEGEKLFALFKGAYDSNK